IVSNDPWMPWEMLRLPVRWGHYGPDHANGGQFLCQRYQLARWLLDDAMSSEPPAGLPWNHLICFITKQDLSAQTREWNAIKDLPEIAATQEPFTRANVREALRQAQSGGLHFIGHGQQDPHSVDTIRLLTDDFAMLPIELSPNKFDLRVSHPLVV